MKRLILFLFLIPLGAKAQDIHFSQMEFSPLTLNPAMAGANYDLEANLNFRSQWNSVAKPYQTVAASVYSRFNPKNKPTKKAYIAGGLDFFNDQSGSNRVTTNHVNLSFATHIILGEGSSLGLGIYGGWSQRLIDPSASTWASQYDGMQYNAALSSGEDFRNPSFNAFDVGAGMVYSYNSKNSRIGENDGKRINVGFSTYHINRPNYSFLNSSGERQYMRFSGFINGSFGVRNSRIIIEPGIYFHQQGPAREIYLGSYVKYIIKDASSYTIFVQAFTASIGLFYRNQDALVVKAMLEWNGMGLGFAYDVNTFNSLMTASKGKGAFEFALRYTIPDYGRRPYVSGGNSFF